MTVGTKGTPFLGNSEGGHYVSWIGEDGKYYVDFSGKQKLRWNDLSLYVRSQIQSPYMYPGDPPIYVFNMMTHPGSIFTGADQNALLARLVSAAKEHDFNLGVAVAEGSQLVNMCASTLEKLSRAMLDLKRGNYEAAARRLGARPRKKHQFKLDSSDISSQWLELQYGWLPAISDVYNSAKAFEALSNGPRSQSVKVALTVKGDFVLDHSAQGYLGVGPLTDTKRIIYRRTEELSALRSLGLADPASVAWEKTPYSFVIDWFLPVGSYLSNLNVIPRLQGSFLQSESIEWRGHAEPTFSPTYGASCTVIAKSYVRNGDVELTVPPPSFRSIPGAMSPKRIFNAIALAYQRIA